MIKMGEIKDFYISLNLHLLIYSLGLVLVFGNDLPEQDNPLFLSPFIKQGEIAVAQKLAEVTGIDPHVKSYSGFITVSEEWNSNLFFWFIPAKNNWNEAPIIFWSDGGPGATLLNSFFNMNGPYKFSDDKKSLLLRNNSWHNEYNMIYLDNPVGVGFSFTDNEEGYVKSAEEAAPYVYEFLQQFLKLFPNLQDNDFYHGGASYGGTYSATNAYLILQNNKNESNIPINLRGVLMDSPWIHPPMQIDYGTPIYTAGLITKSMKEKIDVKKLQMLQLLQEEKYVEAFEINKAISYVDIPSESGFIPLHNLHDEGNSPLLYDYSDFVTTPSFRRSLHVGSRPFFLFGPKAQEKIIGTFMISVKSKIESILEQGVKLLMYAGNLDVVTNHQSILDISENLTWNGKSGFEELERKVWKYDENIPTLVSGYIWSANESELTIAIVRNAAHGAGIYKPDEVLQLINNWIYGGGKLGKPLKSQCQM